MKFKFDWFLKGMLVAVALAFLWPAPGAHGGFLHPELLNKTGIALIFFLNGLGLSLVSLRDGAMRWRVHLLIQSSTFLIFPLLGWGLIKLTGGWLSADLQTGFFYLCALPSTVSSSVALTLAARGNVPVAVFNATLSSLIGVLLTPLWMAWILGHSGTGFAVGPVIVDLLLWLVLPLALGHPQQKPDSGGGPADHSDAGLYILQRFGAAGYMVPLWPHGAGGNHRRCRRAVLSGVAADPRLVESARFIHRGSHRRHVLRLQEDPGFRGAHG